jgi:hypothetical protein
VWLDIAKGLLLLSLTVGLTVYLVTFIRKSKSVKRTYDPNGYMAHFNQPPALQRSGSTGPTTTPAKTPSLHYIDRLAGQLRQGRPTPGPLRRPRKKLLTPTRVQSYADVLQHHIGGGGGI